jgi:hypothetical protein
MATWCTRSVLAMAILVCASTGFGEPVAIRLSIDASRFGGGPSDSVPQSRVRIGASVSYDTSAPSATLRLDDIDARIGTKTFTTDEVVVSFVQTSGPPWTSPGTYIRIAAGSRFVGFGSSYGFAAQASHSIFAPVYGPLAACSVSYTYGGNPEIYASSLCAATAAEICLADFNRSGTVEIDDLFGFLAAWFGNDPRADADANQVVDIDDLYVYLNAWFGGCG